MFDGQTLRFPWGSDVHGIEQAKANARWMSEYLAKAAGRKVWVVPLLVLPGWFVSRTLRGQENDLMVLNHKELQKAILQGRERCLSSEEMAALVHALDRRCRTV